MAQHVWGFDGQWGQLTHARQQTRAGLNGIKFRLTDLLALQDKANLFLHVHYLFMSF